MKRIYYHFKLWEDNKNGMYNLKCDDIQGTMTSCKHLLSTPSELEIEMRYVKDFWVVSTEVNMTCRNRNRQAWLGQAACCLYCGAPEFVTKLAWWELSDQQREAANAVADIIINEFEREYAKKVSKH